MINIHVDKVSCHIRVACKIRGKKIASSSLLNAERIKYTLRLAAQGAFISGEVSADKLAINLGIIPAAQFDTLFLPRLAQAFAEHLAREPVLMRGPHAVKLSTSDPTESDMLLDAPSSGGEVFVEHLAREPVLMTGHHAVKLPTPDSTESDMLLDSPPSGGKALFLEALYCLAPSTQKTLIAHKVASSLQLLLRRLLQHAWQQQEMLPAGWYNRVTNSRLSIAAVLYLLSNPQGLDWLSQHAPTVSLVMAWAAAVAQGDIPPEQVALLLTGNHSAGSTTPERRAPPPWVLTRWLLPLWQQPAVRKVIREHKGAPGVQQVDVYLSRCIQRQDSAGLQEEEGLHSAPIQALPARDYLTLPASEVMPATSRLMMRPGRDSPRTPNERASSDQGVSNAGVLLLWPLLPQLFSLLGLWVDTQFISDTARGQAALCLDRLVWGEDNPIPERLTLNWLLCGISLSTPLPETTPLSVLQQQQTDDWLTAIGQQLVGWEKLSLTDIRQLFLQRPGDINLDGAYPHISVQAEPYDFLLRDWPWPMTLASFPWAEQPLTIAWPLTGLTG